RDLHRRHSGAGGGLLDVTLACEDDHAHEDGEARAPRRAHPWCGVGRRHRRLYPTRILRTPARAAGLRCVLASFRPGCLTKRREERIAERLDLPAPELPDTGQPGAIVWGRLGAGDGFEGRAPAEHPGIEPQVRRGTIAGRLEPLDPRLECRIARVAADALHAGQLGLLERDGAA